MPDHSPWEKVAEAVYICKALEKNLTRLELVTLETYFTGNVGPFNILVKKLSRELKRDRYFVRDILSGWAKERPRQSSFGTATCLWR